MSNIFCCCRNHQADDLEIFLPQQSYRSNHCGKPNNILLELCQAKQNLIVTEDIFFIYLLTSVTNGLFGSCLTLTLQAKSLFGE